MDIKAILKAQGLSDEDITTLTGNEKYTSALSALATQAEQGATALENAKAIQQQLKDYNEKEVVPYVTKAQGDVAKAQAEVAKHQVYLKSLKDQGYEIPDDYLSAAPAANPNPSPASPAAKDYSDDILNSAKANMSLISMSNKYRSLTGNELDLDQEWESFNKEKRPNENMRAYITRRYDLDALSAKKEADKKQKYEDGIREEARKAEREELMKKYGANPETRVPASSKFDSIANDSERKQSWKTPATRDESSRRRIEKYAGLLN